MVWVGRVSDGSRVGCRTVVVSVRVSLGGMPRHDSLPEFCVTDTHVPLLFLGPDLASRPRIHVLSVFVDVLFGFTKVLCISFCH